MSAEFKKLKRALIREIKKEVNVLRVSKEKSKDVDYCLFCEGGIVALEEIIDLVKLEAL